MNETETTPDARPSPRWEPQEDGAFGPGYVYVGPGDDGQPDALAIVDGFALGYARDDDDALLGPSVPDVWTTRLYFGGIKGRRDFRSRGDAMEWAEAAYAIFGAYGADPDSEDYRREAGTLFRRLEAATAKSLASPTAHSSKERAMSETETTPAGALAEARGELVAARTALRAAQDGHRTAVLAAEMILLERVEGETKRLGSNEAERARAFANAVGESEGCEAARRRVRECETAAERAQARLDGLLDARRERETALRERHLALLEAGVQAPF